MTVQKDNIVTMAMFADHDGFQIRSMYDAATFLSDIFQFGHFVIDDARNPNMYYLLSKGQDGVAGIARTERGKTPEFMYLYEHAVTVTYRARKSINKYLKEMAS